jgi:putative transposase
MRQGTTLFIQLIRKIPKSMIPNAIDEFRADRRSRVLTARDHLYILLLGHLHGVSSLRQLISLGEDLPELRGALGMRPVARSTLAEANRSRPHEFFRALMAQVLHACHGAADHLPRRLRRIRYCLDSTCVELCAALFDWAAVSRERAAIKIHVLLRSGVALPEVIFIADGATHDVRIAKTMAFPPGSIVSMDRGYVDGQLFADLHDQDILFVTRIKRGMKYRVLRRRRVPRGSTGIRADQEIVLTGAGAKTYGDRPLRRISYRDPMTGQSLVFLTNSLELAARTVAGLYKERWQVELFFKWIKQNLRVTSFWGRSQNALLVQLWVALLAYTLVSWIQLTIRTTWSRLRTLRYIQTRLLQTVSETFWTPDVQPAK